jgi:predicted small metal-binding protein
VKSAGFPVFFIALLSACSSHQPQPQEAYTPGLGEYMAQLSYRHGKLWFAGQAQNWELAAYELDEIKEGLADIGHYHPTHHEITGIPEQIERHMTAPIKLTAQAIDSKRSNTFVAEYDAITAGCNACHQANGYNFVEITRPRQNVYTDQKF